ncbi:ribonuclease E/G [Microvirga sp. W0021]|uniref:Ribonuclease E n=1 Tax=Hohaiivirga grylli TaxID=3133970 RepID=A0ABV0BK49_9HYPH
MANKMLIDSSHPEETRVVVVRGQKVEEFDFESASRKQLRGNIYLAKVTRVEPSLQAAFVEYGGNRHGFLAFSEIHPDYYQIPVADRQALIEEDARANREVEKEEEHKAKTKNARAKQASSNETVSEDAASAETDSDDEHEEVIEQLGGDALEEVPDRPRHARRQYKIQEVIKRRQILLIQVVKEERGNKGAALTTYLSLAGRYSVLMPNTGRGGGISRKITNAQDRKRLKEIAHELDVPEGMGIILRTAGASRTRVEIKRDYEYLMRMWESVRELTMSSTAPSLVYEEGSLVKRAIRDLYNKDIDEVLVSGDEGYREAKDFMRMLMPSHAKAVKQYKDPLPLFARYGIEAQLDAMFSNHVTLKSGGYLVINPTEALVSIDVNSGRSTREHNIEDTALRTNLEAAEEIARQLRLRDLAGLIVIDFIDMEEKRNNKAVEKKLNECLKNDRARIQVGRISLFGLLEMSRQRIRTGVLESSSLLCPHCAGTGFIRATPSVALNMLRSIEENLIKSSSHNIIVKTRSEIAFYVLNHKRTHLGELESRFGVEIEISLDETQFGSTNFTIERGSVATNPAPRPAISSNFKAEEIVEDIEEEVEIEVEAEEAETENHHDNNGDENGENGRRRRRRRRRSRGRNGNGFGERSEHQTEHASDETSEGEAIVEAGSSEEQSENGSSEQREGRPPRHHRGRRGRRDFRPRQHSDAAGDTSESANGTAASEEVVPVREAPIQVETAAEELPKKTRGRARKSAKTEEVAVSEEVVSEEKPKARTRRKAKEADADTGAAEKAPKKTTRRTAASKSAKSSDSEANGKVAEAPAPAKEEPKAQRVYAEPVSIALTEPDPNRPKRAGWWSRK